MVLFDPTNKLNYPNSTFKDIYINPPISSNTVTRDKQTIPYLELRF